METEPVDKEVLDFNELLSRVGGQQAIAAELMKILLEDAPDLIAEIDSGFAAENAEAVRNAAHSLKGLIFNFGNIESALELMQVELFAKSGDLKLSAKHFERFKPMHKRLLEAILRIQSRTNA